MKRQLLLSLAATLLALPTLAQDFEYTYEGKTLTYTIIDEADKTCEVLGFNDMNMKKYSTDITIPAIANGYTVTSIGKEAFFGCSLLTSVDLPASLSSIGKSAFASCVKLTSIEFPPSITSIGDYAFYSCSQLTSIKLPDSITSIGDGAFGHCNSLTSIELPPSITSIGDNAFYNCSSLTSIELPPSITSIGDNAFYNCSSLTSIELPASISSIGGWAFADCVNLISIELPPSITSIGDNAFLGCSSLTSIELPASITSIGDNAFYNCSSLTAINVSRRNSVYSSIDGVLFDKNITDLICYPAGKSNTTYSIPSSVTAIDIYAFAFCGKLISAELPISVSSIGGGAFYNCSSLTAINVDGDNSVYSSINGVLFDKNITELIYYPAGKTKTEYSVPSTISSIEIFAFHNCSKLTSIELPPSLISIGTQAFCNCSSLTSIELPPSLTSIGKSAFYNCSSLTSIELPASVTSIGAYALGSCDSLTSIISNAMTPPYCETIGSYSIYDVITLYVPEEAIEAYKTHEVWGKFSQIEAIDDQGAIDEAIIDGNTVEVVDGAIVVKGAESVRIYDMKGAQVYSGAAGRIEMPAGIYLVATDSVSKKVRL